MRQHSDIGPSGADRWSTCTASVGLIAKLDYQPPSEWAADGTFLHEVAAQALLDGRPAEHYVGHSAIVDTFAFVFTLEHAEMMQPWLDYLAERKGKVFGIEQRVEISRSLGIFGQMDFWALNRGRLVNADWKFGRGAPVYPKRNLQSALYTTGVMWDALTEAQRASVEKIEIVIAQPRHPGGGGTWITTPEEIEDIYQNELRPKAEAIRSGDVEFKPSLKACLFCDAALYCEAHIRFVLGLLGLTIEDLASGDFSMYKLDKLTPKEKSLLYLNWPLVKKFGDALEAELLDDALTGHAPPGLKAVDGKALPQKPKDEKAYREFLDGVLGLDAYTMDVISPAKARKVVPLERRSELQALLASTDPKPNLVPVADKRPPKRGYEHILNELYEK